MAISQILHILLTIFYLASMVNAVTFTVTGKIYCHHDKEIVTGAKVEFYELDPYFDDFWDSAFTDENGEFSVAGSESEFENEAPYLWIIHKCGSEVLEEGHVHRSRLPIVGDFNEDVYHFRLDIYLFVGIYKVNDARGGLTKWRMKTDSSTRNKDDIPDYALRIIPPVFKSPTDEECKRRNSQSECEHDQQHDGCLWSAKKQACSLCQAFIDSEVHILCDKICLSCHEMFSDKQPNFRAECSDNCYKNAKFRQCVEIFPHSNDNLKFRSLLTDMNDVDEDSQFETK